MIERVEGQLPGRLIAVEGVDGSGKSTQIGLLYKWLRSHGRKVFFSEWNSSELVAEATRKGKRRMLLTPTTFSLIHATDFADRYERQILPMLKAGYIVLCDRYVFTSFARDQARGCNREWLEEVYGFARIPDVTFYFHLPVDTALDRLTRSRQQPNWFEAGMDLGLSRDMFDSFLKYQRLVEAEFKRLQSTYGFTIIHGERSVDDISGELQRRVELVLSGR